MKKIYFSILFISALGYAVAQPIVNQSNYPNAGESYQAIAYLVAPWTPGGSGENQTWDFSTLTNPANFTFEYVAPSETPYSKFSSSDIAVNLVTQYFFFLSSPTEYQISGTATSLPATIKRPYSDPQKIITFPFTYENEFKDTAKTANYTVGTNGDYQRRVTFSQTKADAYGSLTVPGGTIYNNVLRLRITTKTLDSTFDSGDLFTEEDISIDTNYYWISQDFKPHVFVLTKSVQDPEGSNTTSIFAQYFTSPEAPTGNKDRYDSYFSIYPNPFSTELFIDIDENIFRLNPSLSISLHNSRGVEVMQQTMTSNKTILSRKDLQTGIYFYKIISKDNVLSTGKLSIH